MFLPTIPEDERGDLVALPIRPPIGVGLRSDEFVVYLA
jgi:hypothetical protein